MSAVEYCCRICGLREETPPWGEDGETPLFEFCSCCGVEHGYQDFTLDACRKFRAEWLANGNKWDDERQRPASWRLDEQLKQIPAAFR